jgi:MoaA/NifB/PqqE/SkfB family radical SAM enzyme
MKLENIGFYTLYDPRARTSSEISQMKRCELIITEYCNFKCPYCRGLDNYIYADRTIKQLSFEEIKKYIDLWCEGKPLENIRFSGGEPTLHKDIIEIVKYAKKKKIKRIAISTNGSNKIELYRKLIKAGVNDFSISLDACCAEDGDKMSGGIKGSWVLVIKNIKTISKLVYTTVGIVLTPDNIDKTIDTIRFAHKLGVSDIRIISAAQYNKSIPRLEEVETKIRKAHPILDYRITNFINGRNVRGLLESDSRTCGLILDDSIIAGDYHFPCVVYMREKGQPVGKVSENMRNERKEWYLKHDCFKDDICRKNCLDVCRDYNNKHENYHN